MSNLFSFSKFKSNNRMTEYVIYTGLLLSLVSVTNLRAESSELSIQEKILVSYGSDTLANLMYFWGQAYTKRYPTIELELHSEGSSTAVQGLIAGANLGPMSRLMTQQELTKFEKKYGYQPTPIKVGMDAITIFVNRDNPLDKISVQQLDAVFSNNRKCGFPNNIEQWGDLGLSGNWSNKAIQIIGRNKVSGTYGFFREVALCDGRFKSSLIHQPGSNSLVQVVSHSLYAMGFSGLGYQTAGVRTVPIINHNAQIINATPDAVRNLTYPLARFLYIYINKTSSKTLSTKVTDFLNIALSEEGQTIVKKDGYVALSKSIRLKELNKFLP